jgi:NAD(P)-dependent dehydrogenase (short-subunit alcohol dehydrogenase family)
VASDDDARNPDSGPNMVRQALDTWGRLDALVCNAGVDQHQPFHRIGLEAFRDIFEINFQGSLWVTHAAYAHMRAAAHGRIVLSTSSAGLHGLHGLTAYAASKAALIGLMRSLAAEGATRDVYCNAVAPYAATRMTESHGDPAVLSQLQPGHVAPLVELLVSATSTVNGQTILAGGGRFRRAAMMEGSGHCYADAAGVTADALQRDWAGIADLAGAREFPDALASFADFMQHDAGHGHD